MVQNVTGRKYMARKSQKTLRKEVKRSLVDQLKARGADIALYTDLVDDYMALWDEKEKLKAAMEERGYFYETYSATGNPIEKENQAFKLFPNVNRQMLATLEKLGLNTETIIREDDYDTL
jgi:hypothetical protein